MNSNSKEQVCSWALKYSEDKIYHDQIWGKPCLDDITLFMFLCLEGAQAGLSWHSILIRQEAYQKAFHNFDIKHLASFSLEGKKNHFLENEIANAKKENIIKNEAKIRSVYHNAQSATKLIKEYGSLAYALWQFVDFKVIDNRLSQSKDVPSFNQASINMSLFLKHNGFKFIGDIICYAFMQATGMVNDHLITCPQHQICKSLTYKVDTFFKV